jgi:YD repeat-containing protein
MRHTYVYDTLNRLTKDTRSNRTSTSWTYDAEDNLTGITDTSAVLEIANGEESRSRIVMSAEDAFIGL